MKKIFAVAAITAFVLALPSFGGERVVCLVYLNDGGTTAQSTGDVLATATLDGVACPSTRLQPDGGILNADGGLELSSSTGAGTDGGLAGCVQCDFKGAMVIAMQCSDPVYYSEKWDGGVDSRRQKPERGVVPATTSDTLVDFDANPDPYYITFRDAIPAGSNRHVSVKPVSATSNVCKFSTVKLLPAP